MQVSPTSISGQVQQVLNQDHLCSPGGPEGWEKRSEGERNLFQAIVGH